MLSLEFNLSPSCMYPSGNNYIPGTIRVIEPIARAVQVYKVHSIERAVVNSCADYDEPLVPEAVAPYATAPAIFNANKPDALTSNERLYEFVKRRMPKNVFVLGLYFDIEIFNTMRKFIDLFPDSRVHIISDAVKAKDGQDMYDAYDYLMMRGAVCTETPYLNQTINQVRRHTYG